MPELPEEDRRKVLSFMADGSRRFAENFLMERIPCPRAEAAGLVDTVFRQWCLEEEGRLRDEGAGRLDSAMEGKILTDTMGREEWKALLRTGVYLERRRAFLPWKAPMTLLERVGRHTLIGRDIFVWKDDRILGIPVEASTGMMESTRGLFRLNCKPPGYGFDGDPEEGIRPELEALSALLGPPDAPEGCSWDLDSVRLTVACHSANEMYFSETWHKYLEFDVL